MATAADPAPPSRSYYEAYTKKQKAGNRFQDAVFVERGALRVARDQTSRRCPLATERKAIDERVRALPRGAAHDRGASGAPSNGESSDL